jgi:hypothetical protein
MIKLVEETRRLAPKVLAEASDLSSMLYKINSFPEGRKTK